MTQKSLIIKFLIEFCSDGNNIDKGNPSDLEKEKTEGLLNIINVQYIEKGASVHSENIDLIEMQNIYELKEKTEIFKFLLNYWSTVDWLNKNSKYFAVLCEMKKIFVENAVDVNCADNKGLTPLHIAADKGKRTVVRLLI